MILPFFSLELVQNIMIQIISFQVSWLIYKKTTTSQVAYWKIVLLNILGIFLSFFKLDSFYYQIIVFLTISILERPWQRVSLWGSFFFGVYPVIFTDLFARFTPVYVFANLFPTMSLPEIRNNYVLVLLSYVMIYPAFCYINYLSKIDLTTLKDFFYTRGRERLLIGADILFLIYIVLTFWSIYTGQEGQRVVFIAMAVYLLMSVTLNRYSHQLKQERSQEAIEVYMHNLKIYNKHIEDLSHKVKPIQQEFEGLLMDLEGPLSQNRLDDVLSVYHNHLTHLNLDDLALNDKLSVLLGIPYPELRSWLTNHIIFLEQKGIPVDLSVDVSHYPEQIKVAELTTVLERCLRLAEYLWESEPTTSIALELVQDTVGQLIFTIANTNQEAEPSLDDALAINKELAHFCWSNNITLINKKELFKTYQIVKITA